MNKTTEALKLAEEALDELRYANDTDIAKTKYYKALAAIREALSEQEKQEPVTRPLWVELTKGEIHDAFLKASIPPQADHITIGEAVIAAFKEKNK
jgi:Mg-chelatase subunit ChlD